MKELFGIPKSTMEKNKNAILVRLVVGSNWIGMMSAKEIRWRVRKDDWAKPNRGGARTWLIVHFVRWAIHSHSRPTRTVLSHQNPNNQVNIKTTFSLIL